MSYAFANLLSQASRETFLKNIGKIQAPFAGPVPKTQAAVLVPLCPVNNVISLLYIVRSLELRAHGGQVAFPGGLCDKGESAVQAALRETEEEIGLKKNRVRVWGQGPAVPGRKNKVMITPVIGCVEDLSKDELNVNTKEVSEVFAVSLERLCDPKCHYHTQFKNGFILPVFSIDDYKIWGITAYITHIVLSSLCPKELYRNEWAKKKVYLKF